MTKPKLCSASAACFRTNAGGPISTAVVCVAPSWPERSWSNELCSAHKRLASGRHRSGDTMATAPRRLTRRTTEEFTALVGTSVRKSLTAARLGAQTSATRPMTTPTPLPATPWHFPHPDTADPHGVVGVGADLEPATLIRAYETGMFPMPAGENDDETIAWWSPPHRGVLQFEDLRVTRSLRRSCRRYRVTVNHAFDQVIRACAELPRDGAWISPAIIKAYERLHALGWAHSVEVWHQEQLVGGLYGVQIGGLFAGESMFHTANDASKVALVALVSGLSLIHI